MTHTPAPWGVSYGDEGYYYLTHNDGLELNENTEANAKLIAAAPELLEALEWLWESYTDPEQIPDKVIEIIQKAIKKARGES